VTPIGERHALLKAFQLSHKAPASERSVNGTVSKERLAILVDELYIKQ
jgi:hypothetical protein